VVFIDKPTDGDTVSDLYRADLDNDGYVMNLTRLWAWRPAVTNAFRAAREQLQSETKLSPRERAVLVCATARSLEDSYCALAWGANLARLAGEPVAAELLASGASAGLSAREGALAEWAVQVVSAPNETTAEDVNRLRSAGLDDQEIFDATVFIAFREAFSTVNDALGASPDHQLWSAAPLEVREAVAYGRPPAAAPAATPPN
jgi:uncharacterized peroxidase-related enzyme